MALNVKQKYPGTQGGAAQLYASKKNDAFTRGVFRVGVHTHIGALCLVTRR